MGTPFEILAFGERETCENGIAAAFSEIERLERLLSIYREDSEISRMNRGETSLDPDVEEILALSAQYKEMTDGAFDIQFSRGTPACVPSHQDNGPINLGAIGKGYAIDKAVLILRQRGITCAKVSCRSTIYGLGAPYGSLGWPVTIESPDGDKGFSILLCNQALSTSSQTEQCGHIKNPKTGGAASSSLLASVLCKSAARSDALSTAAFILGPEEGIRCLERFKDTEGVIFPIGMKHVPFATSGWSGRTLVGATRWVALTRRAFLTRAASFLIGIGLTLFLPRWGRATVVYYTEEEALKKMFPDADHFETKEMTLTADQQLHAEKIAGRGFSDARFRYNLAVKSGDIIGYGFPIEVIGKERPITLLIGVTKEGKILSVEVLIYRESQGSEIRYPRFMAQFFGKTKENPLRMGEDIQSISGATLSSRGVTYGVRKALALFDIVEEPRVGAGLEPAPTIPDHRGEK